MKKFLSRISKKVLSAILALAVIITSITATITVFADGGEQAPYKVSFSSPVIPMSFGSRLDFDDIELQITNGGSYLSGSADTLEWSVETSSVAAPYLDAANKAFYALAVGEQKITATFDDGSATPITKDFYIVVNEKDDYSFSSTNGDLSGIDAAEDLPKTTFVYTAAFSSPAIPMFINTTIDLGEVAVQLTNGGRYYRGTELNWALHEDSANKTIVVNNSAKTVSSLLTGLFELKATFGEGASAVSKKFYVIVNNENDYEFKLVDQDFSTNASFSDGNWMYALANGTVTSSSTGWIWANPDTLDQYKVASAASNNVGMKSGYLNVYMGYGGAYIYYNAPVLADFIDYTFNAKLAAAGDYSNTNISRGFILRADVNFDAPAYVSGSTTNENIFTFSDHTGGGLYFAHHPIGGVSLGAYGKSRMIGSGWNYGVDRGSLHTLSGTAFSEIGTYVASNYTFNQLSTAAASKTKDIEVVLDGADVKYTFDNQYVILDTKADKVYSFEPASPTTLTEFDYDTKFAQNGRVEAGGAIGFFVGHATMHIYSFSVKINGVDGAEDMPLSAPTAEIYIVDAKNPVIPMTAGQKVDLNNFLVEAGSIAVGSGVTWDTTGINSADLKIENDTIYAYKRGVYKVTATNGSSTLNVYIVVKAPNETEYVLFEEDYRDTTNDDLTKWTTAFVTNTGRVIYRLPGADNTNTPNLASAYPTTDNPAYYFRDDGISTAERFTTVPSGFVPYDTNSIYQYKDVANSGDITVRGSDGTNVVGSQHYIVTVLDNDILEDLQNYKITTTLRFRTGTNSRIGVVGRVTSDGSTLDLTSGHDTLSTLLVTGANYVSTSAQGVVTPNGTATSALLNPSASTAFTVVAGNSVNTYAGLLGTAVSGSGRYNFTTATYEMDFLGDTLTFSSPELPELTYDGAPSNKVTVSSPENKGTVGIIVAPNNRDVSRAAGDCHMAINTILDYKVTLNDAVKPELLGAVDIAGANAEDYVAEDEDYQEISSSYNVTYTASGAVSDVTPSAASSKLSAKIVFADKVGETTITSIPWFFMRENSTSRPNPQVLAFTRVVSQFVLPEKLTEIGDSSFHQATFLEKITLPNTLEYIGEAVFNESGITKIVIPHNTTTLKKGAFRNCWSLNEIEIGRGVTTISTETFSANRRLAEITLPLNVSNIETKAFDGCKSLANVRIYNTAATIADNAFPANEFLTIYGGTGSTAEAYAKNKGIRFVAIDAEIALSDDVNVPVNAAVDLSKIYVKVNDEDILGANIIWDNVITENFSIVNGKLITSGKGTEFTITGTYNGVPVSKVINIVSSEESDLLDSQYTEIIADENVSFVPSATEENVYNVKVNDKVTIIPNSIKISEGANTYSVFALADTTGKSFAFQTFRPEKATVTFETTTENIEDDVFYLGSSIRFANEEKGAALKFMNRLPAIKYDGVNITSSTIALDDGTTATVKAIGTLVIPSILLRDAELKIPANAEQTFNADTQEVVLGKLNGQSALNIKHKTVTAYSEDFSDVKAILGGLADLGLDEQQYKALKFSAVTYIQYTKADGTVGYSYGDVQEKSYGEIEAAMYPEYVQGTTELDALLEGGTENDFVNTSVVNSFSYSLNEDITFKLRIKGNYKINYVLMKDNPSENLYGNESVLDASKLSYLNATNRYNSNCVVASGQFDDRIFTITTQMNQPGTVRLMVEIIGKNGEVVETANLSALADYKNITAAYDESFYVDDATVKAMYDTLRNNVDTFVANTLAPAIAENSTQITGFITAQLDNPQIGAEYTLTHNGVDLMYLQTVYTGNKAVSFNYRIATNAIVGIKANDANHLFDISEGGTYDVASDATGLPTYNLRPSSGYIAIPKDVTTGAKYGILGRYQGYGGYYWNPAYSSSSVIEVGTNGTGVINSYVKNGVVDEVTKNTASSALGAKTPVNGGNNNFIFDSSKTEFEDPTQLFQYGMLIRNYTALKVVELLPFFDETKDVTMRGGSMGAWQSTSMAALYTKVNVLDIDKVWMCSIGVTEAGMLKSEFNPKASKASYYFTTINAAKQIGNREGFEATIEGYLGDYTSPPAGLAALYNVLICKKSLTFNQYKNHSVQPPLGSGTKATATVSAAAQ